MFGVVLSVWSSHSFFFFKQKTAYEMRISDWSSDVCSSDLKDRFPMLNEPEPAYHGVVYTRDFGPAAFVARARTVPLRNTGSALSPMNAFLLLQGMETLPLRMDRHCDNAIAVARYLSAHEKVEWVSYAGLEGDRYHALAKKYCKGRTSALLTLGTTGDRERGGEG